MSASYLVVTDLDGTLLDHHSYSWQPASEALDLLKAKNIPLVLCSSKTAAEMQALREALKLDAPFIVENGAAIYLPDEQGNTEIVDFGKNRSDFLPLLERIRSTGDYRFIGFSDMNVTDVMAATGLEESAAVNALQRQFTEPVLWQDTPANRDRFVQQVRKSGLDAVQGGRFLHVSTGCDKGRAVDWLRGWYAKTYGHSPEVIALGDSDNDVRMLESADLPVLVKSPVKAYPQVRNSNTYRTRGTGPAGWNEAIMKIIENQDRK